MMNQAELMKLKALARAVGYTVQVDRKHIVVSDRTGGYGLPNDAAGYQAAVVMLRQIRQARNVGR